MLTSYLVKCPQAGCNWSGSKIPRLMNHEPWHGQIHKGQPVVEFSCPRCGQPWQARVVGDDVKPLSLEAAVS